jgi:hypothetical protein
MVSGITVADAQKQRESNAKRIVGRPFPKGVCPNPSGRPRGKTLLTIIRQKLKARGESEEVAEAYITAMKGGSFAHLKEYIEREEGKVPDRIANADGSNITLVDRPTWDKV